MHPTPAPGVSLRVACLDQVTAKGTFIQFYDPDGTRHGIPTYPYRWAPKGLLTVRQLRARGLRPGGQQPTAQILWRRGQRVASLYREDLALPKRTATAAQLAALDRALRARRTCPACGTEKAYCIPLSLGFCNDCAAGWSS